MKSAMQQMGEYLQIQLKYATIPSEIKLINSLIEEVEFLIKIERCHISQAYLQGYGDHCNNQKISNNEYYEKNYGEAKVS